MIAIVDYGFGNVASIANMLRHVGAEDPVLTRDPALLSQASRVILPGVGAFDRAMETLHQLDLIHALNEAALIRQVPILGICLGMQLMTHASEEGTMCGLGWFDARTIRFRFEASDGLKVPHIGWNAVSATAPNPLLTGDGSRFYFVHRFHVTCTAPGETLATTRYGFDFPCMIGRDNLFGVQFHPEKSHRHGMMLFERFLQV